MNGTRPRIVAGDKSPYSDGPKCKVSASGNAQTSSKHFLPLLDHKWLVQVLGAVTLMITLWHSRPRDAIDDAYAVCSREGRYIYTVEDHNPQVQCMLIQGSYIVGTGDLQEIKKNRNSKLSWLYSFILNAPAQQSLPIHYLHSGSIVVPGLSDSHAHMLEYGASQELLLDGAKSAKDVVNLVRDFILSNPEVYSNSSRFIIGGGWDHTSWHVEQWPTADDLDADPVIQGRPVILQSKDCHALWLSHKAIEGSLPFPDTVKGGVILRDQFGKPTGVLLDNAQELVKQPPITESDLIKRFSLTVRHAHALGLTSIHDAGLDPISLDFFQRQAAQGKLPIRIYGMRYFNENEPYWGNTTLHITAMDQNRLSARSVKIFADGALRTTGAALYEPYADDSSTSGFMRLPNDVLFDVIPKFLRDGWQVNVHAIGDRANGIVLDAFEAALKGANVSALRPRLEHAQIMTKADMARLGKLGVIASVQPTHVISDMWYAGDRLGPDRMKGLYAFRSIIDSGARLTLGSDFPVESMNPLDTFYAAITRTSRDGTSPHGPGGWFPEQRLTRLEALRGITIDPAYASFTEDILGSIKIGKKADYVVLSQDIMSIPIGAILNTKVLATVLDGEIVYGKI